MATDTGLYRDLLHSAYVRGREDGVFAARFEPAECTGPVVGPVCQGRTPADFARALWSPRPGDPPAGLELNAPHWYARGFAEGVALPGGSSALEQTGPRPTAEAAGPSRGS
jgi:hypothetical protein